MTGLYPDPKPQHFWSTAMAGQCSPGAWQWGHTSACVALNCSIKKENVDPSNNRIKINNKRKPTQEDRGSYTLEMPFDVNAMNLSTICFMKN